MKNKEIKVSIKGILVIIILIIQGTHVYAQINIRGKMELTNGEPISFVNVLLLQLRDSSLVQGQVSDFEGQFHSPGQPNGLALALCSD